MLFPICVPSVVSMKRVSNAIAHLLLQSFVVAAAVGVVGSKEVVEEAGTVDGGGFLTVTMLALDFLLVDGALVNGAAFAAAVAA